MTRLDEMGREEKYRWTKKTMLDEMKEEEEEEDEEEDEKQTKNNNKKRKNINTTRLSCRSSEGQSWSRRFRIR